MPRNTPLWLVYRATIYQHGRGGHARAGNRRAVLRSWLCPRSQVTGSRETQQHTGWSLHEARSFTDKTRRAWGPGDARDRPTTRQETVPSTSEEARQVEPIEYMTMACDDDAAHMIERLNELGAQGWRPAPRFTRARAAR